jgi:hypothetical protein
MAASVLKPRFTLGPTLKPSFPKPPRPPDTLGYGDSCFMAQCSLDSDGERLAKFTGYDKTLGIIGEVENACRLHADKYPGATCSPTRLSFLSSYEGECSGQLYFVFEQQNQCKN